MHPRVAIVIGCVCVQVALPPDRVIEWQTNHSGTRPHQGQACGEIVFATDSVATNELWRLASKMRGVADSAWSSYGRILGYYEGIGGEFYGGVAAILGAAMSFSPRNPEARFRFGNMLWMVAQRGEGKVDTLISLQALPQLECAAELALSKSNTMLASRADSVVRDIYFFLDEMRARQN
jgi:hypothetical protein